MNSLLLSAFTVLSLAELGDLRPPRPPCKDGMFYEESVFDYFNCSICIEQPHYSNCNVCCTATVPPTTPLSPPVTTPSFSSVRLYLPPSTEASELTTESVSYAVSMKPEVLITIGYFIGFFTVLLIAGLVLSVCVVKYYRKKRKERKLGSVTSVRLGQQETELDPSSPIVMGLSSGGTEAL